MNNLQLEEHHRKMLEGLIRVHIPYAEVWIYGSRVKGVAHDGSDLDIVLRNANDPSKAVVAKTAFLAALEAGSIPITVDVSDWVDLPSWLQEDILKHHFALYTPDDVR